MSVFFRTVGTMGGPGFVLQRTGGGLRGVRIPAVVAVVDRPEGLTLIDAGWSRKTCAWPGDDPGRLASRLLGLEVRPEDALASQLIGLGFNPDHVRHVVATHLHVDHVGGVVDFPAAEVHASANEVQHALRSWKPAYGRRLSTLAHRLVPHELAGPAALGFPASHDLFGDGMVLLLEAAGHTRGSVAVAVRLDQGWLVHGGDAAMFREQYRAEDPSRLSLYERFITEDPLRQRITHHALAEAERHHEARVVLTHDPETFEDLPRTREDGWKGAWERPIARPPRPRKPAEDRTNGSRAGKRADRG